MTDVELSWAIATQLDPLAEQKGSSAFGDMVDNPQMTLMLLATMKRFELYGKKSECHCFAFREREWISSSAKTIGRAVAEAWLLVNLNS